MKSVFSYLMIFWPILGFGQESFFLDSLFAIDISNIEAIHFEKRTADISELRSDWGISGGMTITNAIQEEFSTGLSTRVFARGDFWNNGFLQNQKNAQILENQNAIDSINGVERSIDHSYGLFFNYIIKEANNARLGILDQILLQNQKLIEHYKHLYYNKLVEYNEILELENTQLQYSILRQSHAGYNQMFEQIEIDTLLPAIPIDEHWKIDFEAIACALLLDSLEQKLVDHHTRIIDLQNEIKNAQTLSASVGYDISRSRPFFSVSFSTNIRRKSKSTTNIEKEEVINNLKLLKLQKHKEVLNIQYEYNYKEKQLYGLYVKGEILEESLRKLRVKRDILSLEESNQEKKLKVARLQNKYEIKDLKGQMLLLLLRLKKVVPKIELGEYIRAQNTFRPAGKFAGKRFLLEHDKLVLSDTDKHYLEQNEIRLVSALELIEIKNITIINPALFTSRSELESYIETIVNKGTSQNFLIDNLRMLKDLDLLTLSSNDFSYSNYQEPNKLK